MNLPDDVRSLIADRGICYLATTMPDGSPQLTQTWVDADGDQVVINTVQGFQKLRNIDRDPRVALTVFNPSRPYAYVELRGRVVHQTTDGGAEHIEALSQRYTGGPYAWWGGRDQVRVIVHIEIDKINSMLRAGG